MVAGKLSSRLHLPQVTICSADCVYPDLTAAAIIRSTANCEFGDAIFFSDRQPPGGPYRWQEIPRLSSIQDYSDFCLTKLPAFITTDYVLVIQWDGYVVNPTRWRDSFLKYDYMGAVWHGRFAENQRVGNGGFSLRSRRLLDALRSFPLIPRLTEDVAISQLHRPQLEDRFGIRFAPERIADQFSYEMQYRQPTFGFHGFFNMWRHLTDEEMLMTASRSWQERFNERWKFVRLVVEAFGGGRELLAASLYRELRQRMTYGEMLAAPTGQATAKDVLGILESRTRA
jgi:hypothetical protein